MKNDENEYVITDVGTSLEGIKPILLIEKNNLVSTLSLSEMEIANLPNLANIENVHQLVNKEFDIVSSRSGRTLHCKIRSVSNEIGKGGYGTVYIIKAQVGESGAYSGKPIQFAIKLLDPRKNKDTSVFKNSAKKWKIIKNLGLPTFTTYRPVSNNKNILAMTLLSTNDQLCVSLNNDSNDKTKLKNLDKSKFKESISLVKAEIIRISEVLTKQNIKFNHDMFFLLVNESTGSIKVMIGDFDNVSTKSMHIDNQRNDQGTLEIVKKKISQNNERETDLAIQKLNSLFSNK